MASRLHKVTFGTLGAEYIYRGKRRFHCDLVWIGAGAAEEHSRSCTRGGIVGHEKQYERESASDRDGKEAVQNANPEVRECI